MQLLYIFFDIQTVLFVVPEDFVLRVVLVALCCVGWIVWWDVGEKVCGTLCVCVCCKKTTEVYHQIPLIPKVDK